LATFAHALAEGFEAIGAQVDRVPVVRDAAAPGSPSVVTSRLNGYDVVIVQHEYGIYDGPDGEAVLDLLARLPVPVVTVLHTVLRRPTARQHRILSEVVRRSAAVVTMTRTGRSRAVELYGASPGRTVVVPHGAADDLVMVRPPAPVDAGEVPSDNPPVILTWGLLGRGKGVEWAIRAMALLRDVETAPVYVIAGRTHPRLNEQDGEQYRRELVRLVDDLGLTEQVVFDERYLSAEALVRLVRRADVVLLPYDSQEQVTSGVLSEAIAAGKPVVSTRFPHAVELLGDGTGLLVERADAPGIAHAVRRILTDGRLAVRLSALAHQRGHGLAWRSVAADFLAVCESVHAERAAERAVTGRMPVG
jgi:glycosyltransferase involved in cell wall biosynthesis